MALSRASSPPMTPHAFGRLDRDLEQPDASSVMKRAFRLAGSLRMVELLDTCCASDMRLSLAWGSQWTGLDGVRSYLARSAREQQIEGMTITQASAGEQAFSYTCELQRFVPRLRQRWRNTSMWVYRLRNDRIGEMQHFSGPVEILDGDPGRGLSGEERIPVLARLRGEAARRWLADRWAEAGGR
jgi:hypothetical protein